MQVREVGEGNFFRTRLTGRIGVVLSTKLDDPRGIYIKWSEGKMQYVHPEFVVDCISPDGAVRKSS